MRTGNSRVYLVRLSFRLVMSETLVAAGQGPCCTLLVCVCLRVMFEELTAVLSSGAPV